MKIQRHPDKKGYYGEFGGAFVPELLFRNLSELKSMYVKASREKSFRELQRELLRDFAGRPSPLYYAENISNKYGARIFLKREDLNHTGAHKINNTIGQILVARRMGKSRIIAETGAGQHGVATATVCARMGMKCIVYMGELDTRRQSLNVARMKMLGAEVRAVYSGSKTLKDATNEAIRDWIANPSDTHYIIGSVVGPHPYPDLVTRFQSVISREIKSQLKAKTGRSFPDVVMASVGGGSNAAGAFFHFIGNKKTRLLGAEAAGKGVHSGFSAATLAAGKVGILHGCKTLVLQNEDGQITEPYSISAGLDYPGIGPLHAHLFKTGAAEYYPVTDSQAVAAAHLLSLLEGIIPALESAHALALLEQVSLKESEVAVVCLSGRGDKDMDNYINHLKNEL